MTRNEYLRELREKLSRLPAGERDEAISYYTEYFEDAGDDAAAMETLGSPSRLAAQITAEYSARMLEEGVAQRQADQTTPQPPVPPVDYAQSFTNLDAPDSNYTSNTYMPPAEGSPYASGKKQSSIHWVVYVIIGIFALPIALPIAIAIFAVLIALVAVCFALVVAFIAVVVALIASSIGAFFSIGFSGLSVGSVLLMIGGSLAGLGLALLLIPLFIKFAIWLIQAIGKLASKIFNSLKRRTDNNEEK